MNSLAFEIKPSPSSNDHEVRIRIDGGDWLGEDYMGLDPPRLFAQGSLTEGGRLLIGRCECGCEGCDDVCVEVMRDGGEVVWTSTNGAHLHFDKREYDGVVAAARNDRSWEDANRTAERLVDGVFADVMLDDGYGFDWASARITEGVMTLSFTKSGTQKLLEFSWDGKTPDEALAGAKRLYRERVEPGTGGNR